MMQENKESKEIYGKDLAIQLAILIQDVGYIKEKMAEFLKELKDLRDNHEVKISAIKKEHDERLLYLEQQNLYRRAFENGARWVIGMLVACILFLIGNVLPIFK